MESFIQKILLQSLTLIKISNAHSALATELVARGIQGTKGLNYFLRALSVVSGTIGSVPERYFKTGVDIYSGGISEWELAIFGQNFNHPMINSGIKFTLAREFKSRYEGLKY